MKTVLFVDPPAFCTTLAALDDPSLRHRPVAIAPQGADRAVLLALSPEARQAGLERGTPVALARRICPDLIVRPPDPRRWAQAHKALHEILAQFAPVIEPRTWGHSYLDVSGTERLFGSPVDIARKLERETRERLGLPIAVGIAINKLVSATAATIVKRETGTLIWPVAAGYEARFLAPELVALLPDVPDPVRSRLDDYHLDHIGEVAALGEQPLRIAFGRVGRTLHQHAQGIDYRPVLPPAVKAEYRVAHILATDTNDRTTLHRLLRALTERLGRRLRTSKHAAGGLVITVRHADDTTAQRRVRLAACTLDLELWRAACSALDAALTRRVAVRSVAITAVDLHDGGVQFELWEDPVALSAPEASALQKAVDGVRASLARHPDRAPSRGPLGRGLKRVEGSAFLSAPQQADPSTARPLRGRSGRDVNSVTRHASRVTIHNGQAEITSKPVSSIDSVTSLSPTTTASVARTGNHRVRRQRPLPSMSRQAQ
jgi:DNA polymerase-4